MFLQIPLKMEKNEEDFESSIFLVAQKCDFLCESRFNFFSNSHICNVVLALHNVVIIDVENDNVVPTLSNVVQFNFKIYNVVSTLLNVINLNSDVHNVVQR